MYEIEMTDDTNAKEALRQAAFRLPLRTRIISRLPGSNNILPNLI